MGETAQKFSWLICRIVEKGKSSLFKAAYSRKKCFSNKAISRWPLISTRSDRESSWRAAENDPAWEAGSTGEIKTILVIFLYIRELVVGPEWADLVCALTPRGFQVFAYLCITLRFSIHIPQLLWIAEGGLRFIHNVFWAFCVRSVRWLSQIHKILPFLATEADPVQALPHDVYDEATLYLNMM